MVKVEVTTIGIILPEEILTRLRVKEGDSLLLIEAPDGYRITPFNLDFEKTMSTAAQVMHRRRNALRELKK